MGLELRRFLRAHKEYRVQYGLFPPTGLDERLEPSVIKNIGGGGLMFQAHEPFTVGQQLMLKIHITGWQAIGEEILEAEDETAEVPVMAIAEVIRTEMDPSNDCWSIGVKFLGRILI